MTTKKRRAKEVDDPLRAYRKIRKPMPPPQRAVPDKRRELEEELARREAEER